MIFGINFVIELEWKLALFPYKNQNKITAEKRKDKKKKGTIEWEG